LYNITNTLQQTGSPLPQDSNWHFVGLSADQTYTANSPNPTIHVNNGGGSGDLVVELTAPTLSYSAAVVAGEAGES
jgi:hypothetical protein